MKTRLLSLSVVLALLTGMLLVCPLPAGGAVRYEFDVNLLDGVSFADGIPSYWTVTGGDAATVAYDGKTGVTGDGEKTVKVTQPVYFPAFGQAYTLEFGGLVCGGDGDGSGKVSLTLDGETVAATETATATSSWEEVGATYELPSHTSEITFTLTLTGDAAFAAPYVRVVGGSARKMEDELSVIERIEYIQKTYAPVGSYFTDNGEACTSHGNDCSYYSETACNCKMFTQSIQCCGFAKYVFYNIFGREFYYTTGGGAALIKEVYDVNGDEIYNLCLRMRAGDYIQGPGHYMIFLSADEDGLTVYEGNYGGRCRVNVRTVTYASFASQYGSHLKLYTATPYVVVAPADPVLTATAATSVTETSATIAGRVDNPEGYCVIREGYCIGTSPAALTKKVVVGSAYMKSKNVTYALAGLTAGTTYYYRIFCENGVDTHYSELHSFTTTGGTTVTFDAGDGSTLNTTLKGIAPGNPYGDLPTPARLGFVFTGWYTAQSGGNPVTAETTVPSEGSHRLYAHWKESGNAAYSAALTADGTAVEITGYGGTADKATVPDKLGGLPVVSVAAEVFSGHLELKTVTLPDSVRSIGDYAFADCALTAITLPTALKTLGNYVFSGCEALESVTISKENRHFATSGGLLYNKDKTTLLFCPAAKSGVVTVAGSVTDIAEDALFGCSKLLVIALPDGLKTIGDHAFESCQGITSLALPEGLTSIGAGAFMNCTALKTVNIPATVASIGRLAFLYCPALRDLQTAGTFTGDAVDESDATDGFYATRDGVLFDVRTAALILYPPALEGEQYEVPEGTVSIGEYAFTGTDLKQVTVNGTVEHIQDHAFADWREGFTLIGNSGSCVSAYARDNGIAFVSNGGLFLGDVNGDAAINANDATRILLSLVEKVTLTEHQKQAADVNEDGRVAANDATFILLHIVGKRLIQTE